MTKKIDPEKAAAIVDAAEQIFNATPPAVLDGDGDGDGGSKEVTIVDAEWRWADTTVGGKPQQTMMNAMLCIQRLGPDCRHDIFRDRYTVNGTSLQAFVGDLSDAICRKIRALSRIQFKLDPGKECTSDAMKRMCEERRFHPFQDYLNGLKWDGVPRLETWLIDYLGVKDTKLVRAQGGIIIAAIVKRAFEPGCKFDHVPVFEGPEGTYKSSVCRVLANGSRTGNDFHSDSPILHVDERKQQELTAGIIVYELAELAGMRKGDQHSIKNFVTKQVERARPAYGEYNKEQLRGCIYIGTFNTDENGGIVEYLNVGDQRRWWGILVGKIDIPGLEAVRDQLFAEAMDEYEMFGGRNLYLPPALEAQAKAIAKTREKTDPLVDTLSTVYRDVQRMATPLDRGSVTTTDALAVTLSEAPSGAGFLLVKGSEAAPFAMFDHVSGDAWVSAKYVGELVPSGRKSDGSGVAAAMRALKWASVKDRRSGHEARGYAFSPNPLGTVRPS